MLIQLASLWTRCVALLSGARAAWLLLLTSIVAALFLSRLGLVFAGLWAAGNAFLLLVTAAWGVFHPRRVLFGWRSAATWALWGALVSSFTFWSFVETLVAENAGFKLGSGFTLAGMLALFALLAPLLLAGGLLGAATGAVVGDDGPASKDAPRVGVTVCWVAVLLTALSGGLLFAGGADEQAVPLLLGTPVFAALASRAILNGRRSPAALVQAGLGWLARRLVYRRARGTRTLSVDFRGPALGLVAGTLVLLVAATGVLGPSQASALIGLIRLRNEPVTAGSLSAYEVDSGARTAAQDRIVLLEMDEYTRRAALNGGSEAAIQARVIRKLAGWGATRTVLLSPVLQPGWELNLPTGVHEALPTGADIQRSAADLPRLAAAMRRAGNVVLGMASAVGPDVEAAREDRAGHLPAGLRLEMKRLGQLTSAARETGSTDLTSFGSARLPALDTRPNRRPLPAPVLLLAAARRRPPTLLRLARAGELDVAGARVRELAPGRVLVNFVGSAPGHNFRSVPYSSVLSEDPVHVGKRTTRAEFGPAGLLLARPSNAAGAKRWSPAREFFKGKIVFLDSLTQPVRETPIGVMPLSEVLANATATLIAEDYLARPHPLLAGLATLLLGATVGAFCSRRHPLQAGWRAGSVAAAVVAGITILFLRGGIWVDPVVPLLTALGSFLLATQLTFSLERSDRDRNRALLERFVAPQVVKEYLQLEDLENELGLGGRREKVCVLFADVRGFTRFADLHTPEEVIEITNAYLTAMTQAMFAHGGILDKYTGDGLMAIFRVGPSPAEDVERAVRGAIAMQAAAVRVSAELAAQGAETLRVGIGLHYGDAVVGLVGNPTQFNYTALGRTVVVSHRLQGLAAGGEVIISEDVFISITTTFDAREGEAVFVKGIAEPVRHYRIAAPALVEGAAPSAIRA